MYKILKVDTYQHTRKPCLQDIYPQSEHSQITAS